MKNSSKLYNFERAIISEVASLKACEKISERNKEMILEFKDYLMSNNVGTPRVMRYINALKQLTIFLQKDLDTITMKDSERLIAMLNQSIYSPWTKSTYKTMFKRVIKWVKGTECYPDEVKWIKTRIKRNEIRLPSEGDLMTEDDVAKIIEAAEHPRDKALISLIYESGCRIGEIASLQIKNIEFDEIGSLIVVVGKTGSRRMRIISSTPFLATWLNIHPLKNDRESCLWVNHTGKGKTNPIKYTTYCKIIKNAVKKAGITKRFNPHLFRHSRATFMAKHLTEFQMNQYFGWVQGSNMAATYVHLSGKDLDDSICKINGLNILKEKTESVLKPMKCPRCEMINSALDKFCSRCGGVLDIETA
ncbi:MAG: tyrosine-type recombinase/integrase, partial [Nanoarchaeota archaeon]|nr:tyrosine-type recombinase/integrase [Nanoarchaeota archaeon]